MIQQTDQVGSPDDRCSNGDLNYDMLDKSKGATLSDICDIFDLSSLIKSATCHMKNSKPSLVDVLLKVQISPNTAAML